MKIKSKKKKKNNKKMKGGASFFDPKEKASFNKLRRNTCKNSSLLQKGTNYVRKNINAGIPWTAGFGTCMGYSYMNNAPSCVVNTSECVLSSGISHMQPIMYGVSGSMGAYGPICCAGIGCGVGTTVGLVCCNNEQKSCNQAPGIINPYDPFGRRIMI